MKGHQILVDVPPSLARIGIAASGLAVGNFKSLVAEVDFVSMRVSIVLKVKAGPPQHFSTYSEAAAAYNNVEVEG